MIKIYRYSFLKSKPRPRYTKDSRPTTKYRKSVAESYDLKLTKHIMEHEKKVVI